MKESPFDSQELSSLLKELGFATIELGEQSSQMRNIQGQEMNTIQDLADFIRSIVANPLFAMFSDDNKIKFDTSQGVLLNQGAGEIKELEELKEKMLDQVEDYIVKELTDYVVVTDSINALYEAIIGEKGIFGFGDMGKHIERFVRSGEFKTFGKNPSEGMIQKALSSFYSGHGSMGTFIERSMFGDPGGDSAPGSDFGNISTELKTKFSEVKDKNIFVGGITLDLVGDSLKRDFTKKEQDSLSTLVIVYKMAAKMRNLLLINYRHGAGGKSGDLIFEEIILFMVLKIWEVWNQVYDTIAENWSRDARKFKISFGTKEFDKDKGTAKFSIGGKGLQLASGSHEGVRISLRNANWGDLYMRNVDLLQRARVESELFRRRLFGFIRYRDEDEWFDTTGGMRL